ncbi:MAG TPA: glycolate oxidase subunit GlcE [Stellaceae bacterium]|jgi:glycolate oxidase FAD binding subunit|nr:glycolate oxidase subunit GlcE [Stellaceae bacterium]
MTRFAPADLHELRDAISAALVVQEPLELVGGASKTRLGRPLQTAHTLDLSRLSGIRDYAPNELVLTAAAATPLSDIERALVEAGQMLAFEPPDWRGLLDAGASGTTGPTLGGVLACNLSGPRRPKAGAARDHFLGFCGVSGRGEIFKAGGKVVKNVTGYDLSKLMAGSYGTLAALEEVTVKVLPRPEAVATLLFTGLEPAAGSRLMSAAIGSPHEVSGAAYLPAAIPMPLAVPAPDAGIVALRIEGPTPSVAARRTSLLREHAGTKAAETLAESESAAFWRAIGEAAPLTPPLAASDARAVWRISVAPARGVEIAEAIARMLYAAWFLDWGGGLLWVAVPDSGDAGSAVIRGAIRGADGRGTGHATLVKGSPGLRRSIAVFEPQPPALAALSRRVKEAFDPHHILNPGRMVEGS